MQEIALWLNNAFIINYTAGDKKADYHFQFIDVIVFKNMMVGFFVTCCVIDNECVI